MTVTSSDFNNINVAISAYADAARADQALLISAGLTTADARVTDAGENYTGTVRWLNYTDPTTFSKPDEGTGTSLNLLDVTNQAEVYIKNVDATAIQEANMQAVISKVDGLSFLGRQFGAVRARREDHNLRSVLSGVAKSVYGSHTLADNTAGAVVGTFGYVLPTGTAGGLPTGDDLAPLFANTSGVQQVRSTFFDELLNALQNVQTEFELPFYYLAINSATFNILRKENVLDNQLVQDGNITFNTLLGGKIRLILTGNSGVAGAAINSSDVVATGVQTSILMTPGAFVYQGVAVPNPVATERDEIAGNGGGRVTIINRWGNIIHPRGYSYAGSNSAYPTNVVLNTAASWTRQAANVNQTGIFPIFHG